MQVAFGSQAAPAIGKPDSQTIFLHRTAPLCSRAPDPTAWLSTHTFEPDVTDALYQPTDRKSLNGHDSPNRAFSNHQHAKAAPLLEMRPDCERCGTDLPAEAPGAFICSFECTFCAACAEALDDLCPNCGGELVDRPTRAKKLHAKASPSTKRHFKPA